VPRSGLRFLGLPPGPTNYGHAGSRRVMTALRCSVDVASCSTASNYADRTALVRTSAKTFAAPAATPDATMPSASRRTADGVPLAPNICPEKSRSKPICECSPIPAFSSMERADTKSNRGSCGWRFASHVFRSSSIALQKPQAGFQNNSRVERPSELLRLIGRPSMSDKSNEGARSPIFRVGWMAVYAARHPGWFVRMLAAARA